jgi:enterochelin esterase-like enzyme
VFSYLAAMLTGIALASAPDAPAALDLIERNAREKSPVWADGDTATFFYRGEAAEVSVFVAGEVLNLRPLPDSDVWTISFTRPDLEKGVFSYALLPRRKGQPPVNLGSLQVTHTWRGPKAPPAPTLARPLKGTETTIDFASQSLGETRKVTVYRPPGHDPKHRYPTIYATDGRDYCDILEPLILVGKVPPIILVAIAAGRYRGASSGGYDAKKDGRALDYLPSMDADHFAHHEKFFCEEVRSRAEREWGASTDPKDRVVFGCSDGARFALEMGLRHSEWFGNVFAFSVAGARNLELPARPPRPARYYLAAGTWERPFLEMTRNLAEKLKAQDVAVTLSIRVGSHDEALWREEFAVAVQAAFGKPATTK